MQEKLTYSELITISQASKNGRYCSSYSATRRHPSVDPPRPLNRSQPSKSRHPVYSSQRFLANISLFSFLENSLRCHGGNYTTVLTGRVMLLLTNKWRFMCKTVKVHIEFCFPLLLNVSYFYLISIKPPSPCTPFVLLAHRAQRDLHVGIGKTHRLNKMR